MGNKQSEGFMKIRETFFPFGKPNFSELKIAAVTSALRSRWLDMGPETIAFKKDLAEYLYAPYVMTANFCTSTLFLSLFISGVGSRDEEICGSGHGAMRMRHYI